MYDGLILMLRTPNESKEEYIVKDIRKHADKTFEDVIRYAVVDEKDEFNPENFDEKQSELAKIISGYIKGYDSQRGTLALKIESNEGTKKPKINEPLNKYVSKYKWVSEGGSEVEYSGLNLILNYIPLGGK